MYINTFGQGIVIVSTLPIALTLLETRSLNNSDRGALPSFDLHVRFNMDFNWVFSLMPYGSSWRAHRRAFHQFVNQKEAPVYLPIIEQECLSHLRSLSDDASKVFETNRMYFGLVLMRISYGSSDFEYNKRLLEDSEAIVERSSATTIPGSLLVNVFPVLRFVPDWFPGTAWKKYLQEGAVINRRLVPGPYVLLIQVQINNQGQEAFPSVVKGLVENLGPEEDNGYAERETVAMNVLAQSYIAGADTTNSAMCALYAALLMHPEVQRKAQAEIDSVTGGDRLPTPEDTSTNHCVRLSSSNVTVRHG
ncbi:cytochrome P450 [Coprinopsis marcescibilis]|uniref:Cytochrome P450 n=1 Tax=Coprinopsis marcescibilis TaxID=230819 RepID=A0A5C3KF04_COPMA|nr:cytochrome P450 [Coprinopsis marcescibilis]